MIPNGRIKIMYLIIMLMMIKIVSADSGGHLMPQQAAYNVTYYDLDLSIEPDTKTISGSVMVRAKIVNDLDTLILDLDDALTVESVLVEDESHAPTAVSFTHLTGKISIDIPWIVSIGNFISATVFYHGSPKESTHPPWDDGFVWEKTSSGKHWIGVACETGGGDIWWPCKDHPSDEPDSVSLHFTVPRDYTCVSNGQYVGSRLSDSEKLTYDWFVSTPINNYNVTFYIADYQKIEGEYASVSGDKIPFYFWVLPEFYEVAQNHLPVFFNEFHFLETVCGPFPFSTDKHGWAHAPYWGMEHQTIIAYGNDFQVNDWGLDYIHFHELTHEWWGNLLTAKDWSDVWIHEGLGTYMEALYVEHISDRETYHQYMDARRPDNDHDYPLAPPVSFTASEAFGQLNSYYRGAWVMHTLRFHLGDEDFFSLLKHWVYPDTSDTDNTNGRLCRLANTNDMKDLAEEVTGRELDPFFNVFFRESSFPYLEIEYLEKEAKFTWVTEDNVLLDVNVPVRVNGSPDLVEMNGGQGRISLPLLYELLVDPDQWILMDSPVITSLDDKIVSSTPVEFQLHQNFPNPFNPNTTIHYELPIANYVDLSIYTVLGEKVTTLVSKYQKAGFHLVKWDASNLAGGVYVYKLKTSEFSDVKKMVLIR
jgi:aminopeptidase N